MFAHLKKKKKKRSDKTKKINGEEELNWQSIRLNDTTLSLRLLDLQRRIIKKVVRKTIRVYELVQRVCTR